MSADSAALPTGWPEGVTLPVGYTCCGCCAKNGCDSPNAHGEPCDYCEAAGGCDA